MSVVGPQFDSARRHYYSKRYKSVSYNYPEKIKTEVQMKCDVEASDYVSEGCGMSFTFVGIFSFAVHA